MVLDIVTRNYGKEEHIVGFLPTNYPTRIHQNTAKCAVEKEAFTSVEFLSLHRNFYIPHINYKSQPLHSLKTIELTSISTRNAAMEKQTNNC